MQNGNKIQMVGGIQKCSSWATGERRIDGHYYYFGSDGYMKTGWRKENGNWFYYDNYGYKKIGWIQDGGRGSMSSS